MLQVFFCLHSESPLVNYYEEESEPCQCLREEWVLQVAMWCASVMTLIISITLLCASIMIANKDLTVRFRRKAEKKQNVRRLDDVVMASAHSEGCADKS